MTDRPATVALAGHGTWRMGQIALIASIVAGVIMLILAVLGFWHRRRTPAEAELNA